MYYQLLKSADKWLGRDGIILILDITNRVGNQTYNSVIMNNECREYFKYNQSKLEYILPICCSLWYNSCKENKRFGQKEYYISHRYVDREVSKVKYKLFIKRPLGKNVIDNIEQNYCYKLANSVYCTKDKYMYNCKPPCVNVVFVNRKLGQLKQKN